MEIIQRGFRDFIFEDVVSLFIQYRNTLFRHQLNILLCYINIFEKILKNDDSGCRE